MTGRKGNTSTAEGVVPKKGPYSLVVSEVFGPT